MRRSGSLLLLSLCWLAVSLQLPLPTHGATAPTPDSVKILKDGSMTVDGKPFKIKGIAYSPVPVGESVHVAPHGDYFTPDYVYLWSRDLPLLRAMGVNTLRIYSWANSVDHTPFLDACKDFGLHVMLTHYVGNADENPVTTEEDRAKIQKEFTDHVKLYGDHPAILSWAFGNELNGAWNGFQTAFAKNAGCEWVTDCYKNVDPTHKCFTGATCMYSEFFKWINENLAAAKQYTTRPVTSTLADVDFVIGDDPTVDKLPRMEKLGLLSNMDFVAMQLYRGDTLEPFLKQYRAETNKPLLVAEYGVDALNDPCGWNENKGMQPCFLNTPGRNGQPGGSEDTGEAFVGCENKQDRCNLPGVRTQVNWNTALTEEIQSAQGVLGGIIMEWNDQYWKNIGTQDHCKTPCLDNNPECYTPGTELYKSFQLDTGSAECTWKAHVSCSNWDTQVHDVCGYFLQSAPDGYVNEAWFGFHAVEDCQVADQHGGHRMTALKPRPVVQAMTSLYGGEGGAPVPTCEQMQPCWDCAASHSQEAIGAGVCNAACGMRAVPDVGENIDDGEGGFGNGGGAGGKKGAAVASVSATPLLFVMMAAVALMAMLA